MNPPNLYGEICRESLNMNYQQGYLGYLNCWRVQVESVVKRKIRGRWMAELRLKFQDEDVWAKISAYDLIVFWGEI